MYFIKYNTTVIDDVTKQIMDAVNINLKNMLVLSNLVGINLGQKKKNSKNPIFITKKTLNYN